MATVKTSLGNVKIQELSVDCAWAYFQKMQEIYESNPDLNMIELFYRVFKELPNIAGDAVIVPEGFEIGKARVSEAAAIMKAFEEANPSFFEQLRAANRASRAIAQLIALARPTPAAEQTFETPSVPSSNADTPTS